MSRATNQLDPALEMSMAVEADNISQCLGELDRNDIVREQMIMD